jgi:uncharacterized protein (TIGR00725 family)
MNNVIAIIGSAGKIENELRIQVEELAECLSNAGFNLVTGGMDGVMRAVARGHSKSESKTKLIHVEPGWSEPWRLNPFGASIVSTDLGSMRNHLVVRSADLVIAISGGSGTLSEMAIAWQEGKPMAALTTSGGWSTKLAGQTLDHRRTDHISACESVDELVNWAIELRPEGVFTGRLNRGFYPFEVPALHRIHNDNNSGIHSIHARFKMSIDLNFLISKLEELNKCVCDWNPNTLALVTFDDGWSDVLLLEDTFDRLEYLKPVLFIPEGQFSDPIQPLPIQRLYQHIAENGGDLDGLRAELKSKSEKEANVRLDALGVNEMLDPEWLLKSADLERLSSKGWVIASHAHQHEDLREEAELKNSFSQLTDSIESRVHTPWLAWPEGRWSYSSVLSAISGGFQRQFGLLDEPHDEPPIGMIMRKIWS